MRKIVFFYHTGFCGSDGCELKEYPDDVSDEVLNQHAWEGALSNAESYGIYNLGDYDLTEEELEESGEEYSDNIEGYWEEYDPKKHDGRF